MSCRSSGATRDHTCRSVPGFVSLHAHYALDTCSHPWPATLWARKGLHLAACAVWEVASGRGLTCEWKVPQVTPLGSAWSEAESSPGHAGNGCCWAWLSSLFIFLFKKTLREVLWRGGGHLWLGGGFFFLYKWIFFSWEWERKCVCVCMSGRAFVYSFLSSLVTAGQGCNL